MQGIFLGSESELTRLLKSFTKCWNPKRNNYRNISLSGCYRFLEPDEPITGRSDQSVKFSSAWVLDLWSKEPISIMKQFLEEATGTEANFFL